MPAGRSWYANVRANPRCIIHLKNGVKADLLATAMPVDELTHRRVLGTVVALAGQPTSKCGSPSANNSTSGSRTPLWWRSCSMTDDCTRRSQPPLELHHRSLIAVSSVAARFAEGSDRRLSASSRRVRID